MDRSSNISSIAYVKDRSGKTIKFREYEGQMYPDFNEDSLKHATEVEAREDDILIMTYPKAGTHWVFEIVRLLLAGTTDLPVVEKDQFMVEDVPREFINELPTDTPRNLNSHLHADTISPDFFRKRCKIIYVSRNPRDIVTSYFHHHRKLSEYYEYKGEWMDYFPLFLEGKLDYGSWFEHTKGWENCIQNHPDNPFLVISYEGLKQDALGSVKKISDFLGTVHSEDFLKEVVAKSHFDTMAKARQNKVGLQVMYRKGQVGDWRNTFTVAQSQEFNEYFEKEMAGTQAYKLYSHTVQAHVDDNKNAM